MIFYCKLEMFRQCGIILFFILLLKLIFNEMMTRSALY